MDDEKQIREEVSGTVERLENSTVEDIDPLDVYVKADLDGTLREITLVLGIGGPHIELQLNSGWVNGYWGSSKSESMVFDEDFLDALWDKYEMYWNPA